MHLKPGWESKVLAIKSRVYLLGIETKRLVDKTFDKIQRLGRPKYTTSHILFSFFVFIVYKINAKREKKWHVVVNIYNLNNLVILDAYPLPLQSDIITNI